MSQVSKVSVAIDQKSYDIHIGDGLLHTVGALVAGAMKGRKICVVTDETVAKIYLLPLMKNLEAAGFNCYPPIIIPAGEHSKNFQNFQLIAEKCLSYKLNRSSALLALGGGVVGDITGFAAATIMRGIHYIQVPTTLLAQVDSSVGGKTGINTPQGKNLLGAFYQPDCVIMDTETLRTLPLRELRAGYAEIVKYALINDLPFFDWLEANGEALLAGDVALQKYAIKKSCTAKAGIVSADEKEEKDIRALLNLGHTFGHALESIGGYDGRLLHGEAVAIGMRLAFDFSARAGLCPAADALRVRAHLEKAGLPVSPPFAVDAAEMLEKMRGDKKNTDGKMTFILARGIGNTFVSRDTVVDDVQEFLSKGI